MLRVEKSSDFLKTINETQLSKENNKTYLLSLRDGFCAILCCLHVARIFGISSRKRKLTKERLSLFLDFWQ